MDEVEQTLVEMRQRVDQLKYAWDTLYGLYEGMKVGRDVVRRMGEVDTLDGKVDRALDKLDQAECAVLDVAHTMMLRWKAEDATLQAIESGKSEVEVI